MSSREGHLITERQKDLTVQDENAEWSELGRVPGYARSAAMGQGGA